MAFKVWVNFACVGWILLVVSNPSRNRWPGGCWTGLLLHIHLRPERRDQKKKNGLHLQLKFCCLSHCLLCLTEILRDLRKYTFSLRFQIWHPKLYQKTRLLKQHPLQRQEADTSERSLRSLPVHDFLASGLCTGVCATQINIQSSDPSM